MIIGIIGYWLKFADATESKLKGGKWLRRLYNLLLPLTLLVDTFCFFWCWRMIILPELLTKEPVVKFFDDNEFGYKWWKLYKKDIIEKDGETNNSFLDKLSLDELKIQVEREMTSSILKIIRENTNFDIEEYVNLQCTTSIIPEGKLKMYTVTFQYYRWYIIRLNWLRGIPLWCLTAAFAWWTCTNIYAQALLHHWIR
jgi:hypothetical protein